MAHVNQHIETALLSRPGGPAYLLNSVNDVLEVFDDRVIITPKKTTAAFLTKGLSGSKTIFYSSITAIQFRKANPINGYIQFTIQGGIESTGGAFAAITDENTCFFVERHNDLALKIKNYIESKIRESKMPQKAISALSLPEEIQKLSALNQQGLLSDDEFKTAKKRLIAGA